MANRPIVVKKPAAPAAKPGAKPAKPPVVVEADELDVEDLEGDDQTGEDLDDVEDEVLDEAEEEEAPAPKPVKKVVAPPPAAKKVVAPPPGAKKVAAPPAKPPLPLKKTVTPPTAAKPAVPARKPVAPPVEVDADEEAVEEVAEEAAAPVAKPAELAIHKVERTVAGEVVLTLMEHLESGKSITITALDDGKWQLTPNGTTAVAPKKAKLRGAALEAETCTPEYLEWQAEWKTLTAEEKIAKAKALKVKWNQQPDPRVDMIYMVRAMLEKLGIEKYKAEYKLPSQRAAIGA